MPLARSGVVIGFLYWFSVALGPVSLSLWPWGLFPCSWPASRRDLIGNPPPPAEKSCVACVSRVPIFPLFFLMIFCIVFGSVLGDPGASQGLPKYIKIHPKCIPKSIYVLLPFFSIKNMPKCFQINAKTYPKSYQIRVRSNSKKHVFAWKVLQKSRFKSP